ncbi:MAG: hypothetical protein KDA93_00155 [Planctomycetaceae bacterium]|nr:hypothetical protein [Planctomycetaceae bacterium]
MQALLMLTTLTIPTGVDAGSSTTLSTAAVVTLQQTADDLAPQLQTGSLLFNEGDCLTIRVYTASPYTHVAIVVMEDEQPFVYDSMNGAGVRRQSLAEYLMTQSPDELHVYHPSQPLTEEQGRGLTEYLDGQLGREYAVHHHLTGQRVKGVHCAEYVTDALMSIGLLYAERPSKVSPASLQTGITTAGVYASTGTIDPTPPPKPTPKGSNRCHQMWLDTKQCLGTCCDRMSGWFLCR